MHPRQNHGYAYDCNRTIGTPNSERWWWTCDVEARQLVVSAAAADAVTRQHAGPRQRRRHHRPHHHHHTWHAQYRSRRLSSAWHWSARRTVDARRTSSGLSICCRTLLHSLTACWPLVTSQQVRRTDTMASDDCCRPQGSSTRVAAVNSLQLLQNVKKYS